jgi:hypothetical protein
VLIAVEGGQTEAAKASMTAIHDGYWQQVRQLTRSAA